jgi:hypothetical protein
VIHWDRYIAIIGRITQRPECWHQEWYRNDCGTAFCVFGHAQRDAGRPYSSSRVNTEACEWLGIPYGDRAYNAHSEESFYVAHWTRTLAELQELAITQKFPWERAP